MAMKHVGFIVGPFWVFWTKSWNFTIFGVVIDENNSTGLLITILWCLVLILNLFAVLKEPVKIKAQSDHLKNGTLSKNDDYNNTIPTGDAHTNGKLLTNEKVYRTKGSKMFCRDQKFW